MNGSVPNHAASGLLPWVPTDLVVRRLWALVAVTVVFGLAYAPNFLELQAVWSADPNYSHGYLIIPIALVILWRRLSDIPAEPGHATRPAPGGAGSS